MTNETIKCEDYLNLVRYVASKFVKNKSYVVDTEEYSDGLEGLMHAIEKYNAEKANSFATFAYSCIRSSIIQGWRKRNRKKRLGEFSSDVELENIVSKESKGNIFVIVEKILADFEGETEEQKKYKQVLRDHYIEGFTWEEIGDKLGVSKASAFFYGKQAAKFLREKFKVDELDSFWDLMEA